MSEPDEDGPVEIAIVGDLNDVGSDLHEKLLGVPHQGECTLYFDSPGGNPYCAVSLMNLILMRELNATGVVTGECSSAAVWPFAACGRRIVTPYSNLLFHSMKWQSEENVPLREAAEWARHFGELEQHMDRILTELLPISAELLEQWIQSGRYVSGIEFADAGAAELVDPLENRSRR